MLTVLGFLLCFATTVLPSEKQCFTSVITRDAKSEQDQSDSDDATLGEPYLLSAVVVLGVAVPVVVAVVVRWQGSWLFTTLGRLQATTDDAAVQHAI